MLEDPVTTTIPEDPVLVKPKKSTAALLKLGTGQDEDKKPEV